MDKKLFNAIGTGNIRTLEKLIVSGIDIKQKKDGFATAIHIAALYGKIPMLEYLLEKKYSKIDEKDDRGMNALHYAVSAGQIPMVEHLLAKQYFKITERSQNGDTALIMAASAGKTDMIEFLLTIPEVSLLEKDTERGCNVLTWPALNGHLGTLAYLLKRGAYIDLLINDDRSTARLIQHHSNKNTLPLLQAAEALIQLATGKQASETAESAILTLGESLNARRVSDGNTALHLAILNKNLPLIKLLLENNADVTMPNKDQETPFQLLQKMQVKDPYILAMAHIVNINENAKILDYQREKRSKTALPPSSLEVKQRQETTSLDAGDEKGGKERLELATTPPTQLQNSTLFKQCEASIAAVVSLLETLPTSDTEQVKQKKSLFYKLGALLAKPLSCVYSPVAAYNFLAKVTKESPNFPEAQGFMAELLISGNIIFVNNGLDEPVPIAVSAATGIGAASEDTTCCAVRQKAIIKHLLQGSTNHEGALGKYIAEYTLGANKSIEGLKDVKGKDVDSLIALIEEIRKREIENKILQEKLRTKETELQEKLLRKESENAQLQEKLRSNEAESTKMLTQITLMQEKLKLLEMREAENRRLEQENSALKNQSLEKEKSVKRVGYGS